MKFLDSNVFIYAFYKPKRQLNTSEKAMKDSSKKIISNIQNGKESVVTTVVHLSEIINILKHSFSVKELAEIAAGLLMLDNVEVLDVSKEDYFVATELGQEFGIDPNDALAVQVIQTKGLTEIYSFDKAFEKVEGIARLPIL
ncbi:MAG: type II toxin-antitoxin system VapC family toxin [Thaumarchaeota archaeon]|nr:type II toxin-antitoxin system VapC family toxin [Nitrososphaerota archaeon]